MKYDFTARFHVVAACLCAALALVALCADASPSSAEGTDGADRADKTDGRWHYNVTPYVWLPNVNARLSYRVHSMPVGGGGNVTCAPFCEINVQVGPNGFLSGFKPVGGLAADAHRGKWGVALDVMYMNFSGGAGAVTEVSSPLGPLQIPIHQDASTLFTGEIETLEGSYSVLRAKQITTDVLAGFRATTLIVGTDWDLGGPYGYFPQSGTISKESEPLDVIVGARGRGKLGGGLFIPYYLDVGTGTASSTAQEIIGIGYSRKASLQLVYRNLAYTSASLSYTNQGNTFRSARFSGPMLGLTFRF
jgi:hypothetical protein